MAEASQSRLGITRAKISQNLSHSNMNVVKSLRRSLRRSKKTRDKSTESSRSKSADRLDISGNGNASSAYNKDGDEEEEEIGVVRRERQKEEQLKQVAEATPAQPNNNNNVEVVQFGNEDDQAPLLAPVPAPRESKSKSRESLNLNLEEEQNSDETKVMETTFHVVEDDNGQPEALEQKTGVTITMAEPPFDSLEGAGKAMKDGGEDEPKIFINNDGEWVVEDEEAAAAVKAEEAERKFLKDLSESPVNIPKEDEYDEDDIPEEWKAVEHIPVRQCVQVGDDETSESPSEQSQVHGQGMMSVIEEVEEDVSSSATASEDERKTKAPVQQTEALLVDLGEIPNEVKDAPNVTEEPPVQEEQRPERRHPNRNSRDERVSPDTVTSGDSGVVDPHDEMFSPNDHKETANPGNTLVRSIAKFWEGVVEKDQQQETFASLSKKWKSMPDLEAKRKQQPLVPVLEPEYQVDDDEDAQAEEQIGLPGGVSHLGAKDIVHWDDDQDDRDVCTLVPIKERMKMFESLATQAQIEKKKQWFSMPSLDGPKKSKDSYSRYPSAYGRQTSENHHHYNPMQTFSLNPNNKNESDKAMQSELRTRKQASPASIVPRSSDHPMPLVSATSKDSEDFDLTPLRDRMKAFQGAGPVSKPVVSVNKTVSPLNQSPTGPKAHRERIPSSSSQNFEVDETASLTDSVASSHTSSSTVISASKINRPSMIPTYSWNDESNGEIYNDKPATRKPTTDDSVLYVVENGQEFPLTPVAKRKSAFLSTENLASKANLGPKSVYSKDITKIEPVILSKKEKEQHRHQQQLLAMPCDHSSGGSSSSTASDDFEDEATIDEFDQIMRDNELDSVEKQKETIKSSSVPYIEEEQEVLSNINLVKAMKEKFLVK